MGVRGGAEPAGAGTRGAASGGAESGRAEPGGVPPQREPLSPQQLREWYSRRCWGAAGAAGGAAGAGASGGSAGACAAGGAAGASGGAAGAGAAGFAACAGASRGSAGAGAAGGAAGAGAAGGAAGASGGAAGAGAAGGAAGAGAAGGSAGAGATGCDGGAAGAGAAGGASGTGDLGAEGTGSVSAISGGASRFKPPSPLPGPSPYSGPTRGLTERREPESRPVLPESRSASPVRPVRAGRVSPPCPPPVPGTPSMTQRPSTAPRRVPLLSPPTLSLLAGPDPASDSLRAASLAVTRFLATAVTDPLFESTAASALVTELVDFAAACRLDYAASLVAESASLSVCPLSVKGECALGTDVLDDRQEEFECFAASVFHLVSMLLATEGDPNAPDIPTPRSYAEAIEGPYSSQWQAAMHAEMASWKSTGTYVDEVPPPGASIVGGMWIFRVKWPPGSPPVFEARYVARGFSQRQGVDFFQTFSPTPKMTTLHVLLHWHDTLRTTLAALGFAPSTSDPSLFLRTDTTLPPFYVLVYVDDLVFATADTETLAHVNSNCEAEIYAGAMAAQELRWLTYLLTDLGEAPRSPPVLYVDNKAMLALCQEHRLEHRTKHIAMRYFLARELQQRGQFCPAYVASQANTTDVFTKALQPCDHLRFCIVLGLVPTVPHFLTS
ncbi:unnamed protein product [Closterium sp. NIES-53]